VHAYRKPAPGMRDLGWRRRIFGPWPPSLSLPSLDRPCQRNVVAFRVRHQEEDADRLPTLAVAQCDGSTSAMPHRNEALGRGSTPEEAAFLLEPG